MAAIWQQNTNLYVGRNRELSLLASYLESSEGTVAVIKGVAGIGKSCLARRYAEIHKNKYSNVVRWRGYNLPQSFQLLPNTLLIIDDADEIDNGVIERVQRANMDILYTPCFIIFTTSQMPVFTGVVRSILRILFIICNDFHCFLFP